MFRLGHQIRCQIGRLRRSIGQNQYFTRTCDHIDIYHTEQEPLRSRDVDIAGADDLVDLFNRLGAVGQSRDSLRTAAKVDGIHPGNVRSRHHR